MTQNWNRRYRENMVRLKSGDLLEVARVVKGLLLREGQRGLSNGERKMLHTAKQILISELVLAQSLPYKTVEANIDTVLSHEREGAEWLLFAQQMNGVSENDGIIPQEEKRAAAAVLRGDRGRRQLQPDGVGQSDGGGGRNARHCPLH